MCCFSRAVEHVSGTRIFARRTGPRRQALAYSMSFAIDEDLAMVLPLPTPTGTPEDAVRFLDLSDYEGFFDDLDAAFPDEWVAASAPRAMGEPEPKALLVVHDVGAFIASHVPAAADFPRLDPRFRLPAGVLASLPYEHPVGFAVFQLKAGGSRRIAQPMAFTFPSRRPRALFYPTLHVHDGETLPAEAHYDHKLFCQGDAVLEATIPWQRSSGAMADAVDVARTHDLVDGARPAFRTHVLSHKPNHDLWVEPPDVDPAALHRRGPRFALRLGLAAAYQLFDTPRRPELQAHRRTARDHPGALSEGLAAMLGAFTAERGDGWGLVELREDLPHHWLNGSRLWRGEDWARGNEGPGTPGLRGRLTVRLWNDRVEPQHVTLAFDALPDDAACVRLQAELTSRLDTVVTWA